MVDTKQLLTRAVAPRPTRGARLPASLIAFAAIVAAIVVGPVLWPHSPTLLDNANAFAAPSWDHWLGTDEVGRDMFSRVLAGGRLSLGVAAGAVVVALLVGTAWGAVAAVRRGFVDNLLMRTADVGMAVPQILFALLCVASFGASLVSLVVIIGLILAPSTARMARATVLQELHLDYASAAIAYGASKPRLLFTEVLPNAWPGLAAQAVINVASAMILEASLSFVGLGVQPPTMSWGVLLQQGYGHIYTYPIYAIAPAVAVLVTVLCLNLLADRSSHGSRIRKVEPWTR